MKEGINADAVSSLSIIFLYVIVQQSLSEFISWYYVYKHDDYKDLCEKCSNLNARIKELKDSLLYGTSDDKGVKRKQ